MPDSSSSSSFSSKLVYFVVIPLILLSALVILLNQKPSSSYSLPSFHDPVKSLSGVAKDTSKAPPLLPATPVTADQLPKPSSSYSLPSFHDPVKSHSGVAKDTSKAPPLLPATPVTTDQLPKPSSSYSLPSFHDPVKSHFGVAKDTSKAPPLPATPVTADQLPVMETEDSMKSGRFRKRYSNLDNLEMVEASLAQARENIKEVQRENKTSYDPDFVPEGPIYRNANAFHRSYLEMEKEFKIYVYEDGDPPLFHYSKSLGILGIEGILIHQIEISKFRTRDPEKAHVYFIPLSAQSIATYAYVRHNRAWTPLQNIARDYVQLISKRYPYWNRTLGHDHFILGCHDWTPTISHGIPHLYKNSIRVLCNANISEGFKPSIDVSMPEIYLPDGTMNGLIGGPPPSERTVLVFYAGGIHGYIRQVLMDHWKDKDPDVQIHEYLPKGKSYYGMFRKSKFCICPSGWEVASPRMVEAIYMGCVPVLLKDHYAKPFDDVLDWSTFAVDVGSNEIGDLKKILKGISAGKYLEMQRMGIQVRRHFEVNFPPKRYDVFHMILHSIWLRRMNIQLHDTHQS